MNRLSLAGLVAIALVASPFAGRAAPPADLAGSLLAMRVLDERVARLGHALAVANLDLCADRQWLPGFAVHELSQYGGDYRDAARRVFGLAAEPAILALADDGPAARAGIRRDDALLRLDGLELPLSPTTGGGFDHAEQILDAIDRAFADGAARIDLRRGEERLTVQVQAQRGCASRFQIVPSQRMNALADGRYVQLTTAIAAYAADDDELAAIIAHEFAHNILRHRVRLDEADVARGFLGNFGRNARRIRETEVEADRLSVYLLDRAGHDPEAPIRFWSRFGRRGLNFLGSATHPNWRRRVETFREEVANIRRAHALGVAPMPAFPAAAAVQPAAAAPAQQR